MTLLSNGWSSGRRRARLPGSRFLGAAAAALSLAFVGSAREPAGPPVLAEGSELPVSGRLLWLDGRPTVRGGELVAARDSAGRVLVLDDRLRGREALLPGEVASVVSAAPAADGTLWIVDGEGRLLRVTVAGELAAEVPSPYRMPALGAVGDGILTLVRSVEGFPYALDTEPESPVAQVDASGRTVARFGGAATPEHVLLSDLANAGHVIRVDERTIYAPFVRDEVVAFGPTGDTAWVLRRGLAQETPEPRFVIHDGRPAIDYFPVNLGLGLGPDGRLYVLSTADTTLDRARLDVLDPGTGRILATFPLPTAFPTVVVARRGTVHLVSSSELLARVEDASRPAAPAFDLPTLDGGRVTHEALRDRVTIVNLWASWCAPCREEMPELVALWEELSDSGLALLAVNEDVDREDARRWLEDEGLAPPVALAGGRGRSTFHYPGLPYTLLVDTEGRIAGKWIGYLGPRQIDAIRAAARRELGMATRLQDARPVSAGRGHEHSVRR